MPNLIKRFLFASLAVLVSCDSGKSSPDDQSASVSVLREWNEILLEAIRNDFARPTIHARNLFHLSAAGYDAWAAYQQNEQTYLFGKSLHGFSCNDGQTSFFLGTQSKQEKAISYASFRLLEHRFKFSPARFIVESKSEELMEALGYDISITSTDFGDGSAAKLGNYIADCYIRYGQQDGSNEANDYANLNYAPVNPAIEPDLPGNPNIVDIDNWQPVSLPVAIDQAGNIVQSEPIFLGPEWGRVYGFSLTDDDKTTYVRDGFNYEVYFDPGSPPSFNGPLANEFKWNFSLVSIWSSHLDHTSGVTIDISPKSLGNNDIDSLPINFSDYRNFYQTYSGGDTSQGYSKNAVTDRPYDPQVVPLGDYTRVLAEFWADGPESETPPGHWFVLLNTINDDPRLEKRFGGEGSILDALAWDAKAYFILGGAMHDAAIASWGIKGWYDYVRPVSAIRAMADLGQSSDSGGASYNIGGLPLEPGYIELVEIGDPLAGLSNENVGKIKIFAWRGPDYISDPSTDYAGVGWILAENWWPYQRPTFVTPPFAGYISGHSTFSRAAAEVLTAITGSPFFPGGVGEFTAKKNEFLVFEEGPSVDVVLQWATYRDAADQCSLSRIWGGIHPPADDLAGRRIGESIGKNAFEHALQYF